MLEITCKSNQTPAEIFCPCPSDKKAISYVATGLTPPLLAFTGHALVTNAQFPGYYDIWQEHTSNPAYCVPLELTCSFPQ